MKETILFTGTGAADWHLAEKSDEYRRFSSALVCGDLLIDAGPDIFDFEADFGYTDLYKNVKNILITHSHADHYTAESISKLNHATVWSNKLPEGAEYNTVEPFKEYNIGGYTVIGVPANHLTEIPDEMPLHYIIKTPGGKTFFYGCDGAWIMGQSWHELKKHKFDLMIFDGTIGNVPGDYRIFEHNNTDMVKEMCRTFRALDVIKPDGKVMISHLALTLHPTHKEVESLLKPDGIIPAFDNMNIEI